MGLPFILNLWYWALLWSRPDPRRLQSLQDSSQVAVSAWSYKETIHTHTHTHTPSPQPRPQCRNPVSFREFPTRMIYLDYISRVSDQNGVSVLYIMLDIHHSGWEPWIYRHRDIPFWSETLELFCVYPEYILFSSAAECTTWQTRSMLLFGRWRQRKGAASPSRWPTWWSSACPRASSRTRSTPASRNTRSWMYGRSTLPEHASLLSRLFRGMVGWECQKLDLGEWTGVFWYSQGGGVGMGGSFENVETLWRSYEQNSWQGCLCLVNAEVERVSIVGLLKGAQLVDNYGCHPFSQDSFPLTVDGRLQGRKRIQHLTSAAGEWAVYI